MPDAIPQSTRCRISQEKIFYRANGTLKIFFVYSETLQWRLYDAGSSGHYLFRSAGIEGVKIRW
jgi:hypothetical protein